MGSQKAQEVGEERGKIYSYQSPSPQPLIQEYNSYKVSTLNLNFSEAGSLSLPAFGVKM